MQKNDLLQFGEDIIRVLELRNDKAFVIDCNKRTIPQWVSINEFQNYTKITETELQKKVSIPLPDMKTLDAKSKCIINKRYTMLSGILPYVSDFKKRNKMLTAISAENGICRQTLINYLCLYLVFQNKIALAPKSCVSDTNLTADEKNFRWSLGKFFYNQNKNSLKTAYTLMLKEKYCDSCGVLLPKYPSFNQFRYFYRKTKSMQNYYISRYGIKNYQRNHRPLLGDGVHEFAPNIGVGMLDSTICDIYLVNSSGNIVGRPILTACIDAYSSLCCGYSLSWEGGMYSLRGLMLNVIEDKVEHCKKHGISISKSDWNCDKLPAVFVTDMGSEYKSENFEQIAELGITLINLPAYRPELKGSVEKFFDLIQNSYKPYLKGKGVVEPDYQERGSHDYRKDACLTMDDFEKVILYCILYYNSQRILTNYPYTEKMIDLNIQPYANCIWEYGKTQDGANLITVDKETLILILLPRTKGRFDRNGLKVNKLRYKHHNYTEKYIVGGEVTVAYNPDDVSCVWLIENGMFIRFELIESRFKGKDLVSVQSLKDNQKQFVNSFKEKTLQAQIELAEHIQTIASTAANNGNTSVKEIRVHRQREQRITHRDFVKEGVAND